MVLNCVLFFLLYFRLTDVYFSNHLTFRAFHCSSLALLSLKNTIYYGKSIIDRSNSIQTLYSNATITGGVLSNYYNEHYYLKIIPLYFIVYLMYDLKHSYKRIDLFFHHLVCLLWALTNIRHLLGFMSFIIFAEGVTFAYAINIFKNQLMYRLIFSTTIRFPIWITTIHDAITNLDLFNFTITFIMFLLDCVWVNQNYKKYIITFENLKP
jgi:multisubunit Na+/H+ antiporter MnhF subunit